MLHLLTPFKSNLLAHFAFHPSLSQGLAKHSWMGEKPMACSSPFHLFSLQALSNPTPPPSEVIVVLSGSKGIQRDMR